MATVSAVILHQNQKEDGTFNVNIRIWHNNKSAYIHTMHFVGKNQVKKKGKGLALKDNFVIDRIAPTLKNYRDFITENSDSIKYVSAKELKEKLEGIGKQRNDVIDFISFSIAFIKKKKDGPKSSSAPPLVTVVNSLVQYTKRDDLPITEINYNFLTKYAEYLSKPRSLKVNKNGGGTITKNVDGLSESGLHNHMRDLRLLFNEARNVYNDEDQGIIKILHYPFKKYKIGSPPLTPHRDRTVRQVLIIRDTILPINSRAELARDIAMLSLYMCGMNAIDIYKLPVYKGEDRINYNRSKTKGKRKDKAFISVKVVNQARPLLAKYAGKLQKRYSSPSGLNKAIDKGMDLVSAITEIPNIDFYDFRHSFGTWARNICRFSTDEVAISLNQKERTVTDIYTAPDWNIVDRVQQGVISLLTRI